MKNIDEFKGNISILPSDSDPYAHTDLTRITTEL